MPNQVSKVPANNIRVQPGTAETFSLSGQLPQSLTQGIVIARVLVSHN